VSAIGFSPRSGTRLPRESRCGGNSTVSPESDVLGESERERRWSFDRLRFRRCSWWWWRSSGDENSSADNSLCTGSRGNLTDLERERCCVGVAAPLDVGVVEPGEMGRGECERPRGEAERPRGDIEPPRGEITPSV
jgi:hypothetical protein